MIQFSLSGYGPSYIVDGVEFIFKKINSKTAYLWSLKNDFLLPENYRSTDNGKVLDYETLTSEQKEKVFLSSANFARDHLLNIKGLKDYITGKDILYQDLSSENVLEIILDLMEDDNFNDWLSKYLTGSEKKSI